MKIYQMIMGRVFENVAQSVPLLYRRMAFGKASYRSAPSDRADAPQNSILRHSRVTLCATVLLSAVAFSFSAAAQGAGGGTFGTNPQDTTLLDRTLLDKEGVAARPEQIKFPPLNYQPPAPEQYRVQLKSGPIAYVVPDHELPLVNIVAYVHTGEYLEPQGKEGLASMTGYLLARGGAGTNSADQLEERLAFLAADLSSDINGTQGSASLNLLSKDLDEGLSILKDVLFAPRFQDDKIALRKQQLLQAMKERNDDASAIEDREHGFLAFGENFWANHYSTAASLEAITRALVRLADARGVDVPVTRTCYAILKLRQELEAGGKNSVGAAANGR